jgi:hypothetical protein
VPCASISSYVGSLDIGSLDIGSLALPALSPSQKLLKQLLVVRRVGVRITLEEPIERRAKRRILVRMLLEPALCRPEIVASRGAAQPGSTPAIWGDGSRREIPEGARKMPRRRTP